MTRTFRGSIVVRRLASYLSRVESVESNGCISEDHNLCVTGVFIFARDTSDDQIRSRDWQTSYRRFVSTVLLIEIPRQMRNIVGRNRATPKFPPLGAAPRESRSFGIFFSSPLVTDRQRCYSCLGYFKKQAIYLRPRLRGRRWKSLLLRQKRRPFTWANKGIEETWN